MKSQQHQQGMTSPSCKVKPWEIVVTDIEGNGLYYEVDTIWCGVCIDVLTGEIVEFGPHQIDQYLEFLNGKILVGHNLLDYDLPVLLRLFGFRYTVDQIFDTLVMSRLQFPERPGGHSLGAWGQALGEPKIDWRAKAEELGLCSAKDPKGAEFKIWHPEMLVYNKQDCKVNLKVLKAMLKHLGWTLEDLRDYIKEVDLYGESQKA